ncbi:MAG TPA: peptide chain release factor 1, partial [archaeon]|nr:peptide chain release factor 1 [archaeon]
EVKGKCSSCGDEATHVVERAALVKCMKCGGAVREAERTDLEQVVLKLAEQMGTHVELVSTDSPKGEQLLALGGIGGIQRYKA